MSSLRRDLLIAAIQQDFYTFMRRCFGELWSGTAWDANWHIEVVAAELATILQGVGKRLIVNVPPRHLKSLIGSVALPAWLLGHNPTAQIICVSYAQDLADKLSRDCRKIMASAWYQAAFPQTQLSPRKQAASEFETTAGGFRLATSVGGVLTGRGADLIIIDDPLKPDQAASEVQRRAANDWFDSTLLSRLNNKRTGQIVIIMQRLHEDDLCGHVLAKGGWEHLRLCAVAETDETWRVRLYDGQERRFHRAAGEPLHAAREPLDLLAEIRRAIGQYQQSPAPAEGAMVKVAWLRFYEPGDLPATFDTIFQSWDTANKVSELSDYSVCTTWGARDGKLYLLDVLRERMDYPTLKRAVQTHHARHRPGTILIEDRASGTQLLQELRQESLPVHAHAPMGDKAMRMHGQCVLIENGRVFLPRTAPWLDDYVRELTTFPNSKHDDQVDSTSQALAWFSAREQEPAIITYYKQENRKFEEAEAKLRQGIFDEWGGKPPRSQ